MDYTQERNAELYRLYRKFMNEINTTHAEAVRKAVNSPASRYWVSPNYLYREVVKREQQLTEKNTDEMPAPQHKCARYLKSTLYDRLYSDYLSIRRQPTCRELSKLALCDLVVNRPAPSFFLSEKRANEIIMQNR